MGYPIRRGRGRGGGGIPATIPNLAVWLKADAGTYQDSARTTLAVADGDPVGGWVDQSGAGSHASQLTSTKRPLLKLATINGLPSLLFDAVDDGLATALALPAPYTIFVVEQCQAAGTTQRTVSAVGVNRIMSGARTGGIVCYTGVVVANSTVARAALASGVNTLNVSSTATAFRMDGVDKTTGNGTTHNDWGTLSLGWESTGTEPANARVGEVIAYTRSLTLAEMQTIEAYLKARWGTP